MPTLRGKARLATDSSVPSDQAFRGVRPVDLRRLAAPSMPYAGATADCRGLQTRPRIGRRATSDVVLRSLRRGALRRARGCQGCCRAARRSRRCRKDTATRNGIHLATAPAPCPCSSCEPLERTVRPGGQTSLRQVWASRAFMRAAKRRCDRRIGACDAGPSIASGPVTGQLRGRTRSVLRRRVSSPS